MIKCLGSQTPPILCCHAKKVQHELDLLIICDPYHDSNQVFYNLKLQRFYSMEFMVVHLLRPQLSRCNNNNSSGCSDDSRVAFGFGFHALLGRHMHWNWERIVSMKVRWMDYRNFLFIGNFWCARCALRRTWCACGSISKLPHVPFTLCYVTHIMMDLDVQLCIVRDLQWCVRRRSSTLNIRIYYIRALFSMILISLYRSLHALQLCFWAFWLIFNLCFWPVFCNY